MCDRNTGTFPYEPENGQNAVRTCRWGKVRSVRADMGRRRQTIPLWERKSIAAFRGKSVPQQFKSLSERTGWDTDPKLSEPEGRVRICGSDDQPDGKGRRLPLPRFCHCIGSSGGLCQLCQRNLWSLWDPLFYWWEKDHPVSSVYWIFTGIVRNGRRGFLVWERDAVFPQRTQQAEHWGNRSVRELHTCNGHLGVSEVESCIWKMSGRILRGDIRRIKSDPQ